MERAGDLLKRFFEYHNLGSEGQKYVSFFSSWNRIAGRDLAAHSQIADIRHNAAVIEVDHPAWMQMLQMKQKAVLERMQAEFPDLGISSIQMRLVDRPGWTGTANPAAAEDDSGDRSVGPGETAADGGTAEPESGPGEDNTHRKARLEGLLDRLKEQVDARERERNRESDPHGPR